MNSPRQTIETLLKLRSVGNIDAILALYEKEATIVTARNQVEHGTEAIRTFLRIYVAMKPTFTVLEQTIIEGADLALHISSWSLTGTDSNQQVVQLTGLSSDVLRKQRSGEWLIAIDNPFVV